MSERDIIPVVSDTHYKILMRPATAFDSIRRTTVHPDLGISYVYGIENGTAGPVSEVIEVWFDRSLSRWTAASVIGWMQANRQGLPVPTRRRSVPAGAD